MRRTSFFIAIIGLLGGIFLDATHAQAKVWEIKHHWSDIASTNPATGQPVTYDDLCADFTKEEMNENSFSKPNGYYYGALDCGETPYVSRAICASIYNLPFSVAGGTVTNNSTKFDKYSSDKERLRAFIQDMIPRVNTNTLSNDTYPVKIDRKCVHAGEIMLDLVPAGSDDHNHALIVTDVGLDGSLTFLQGTYVDRKNPNRIQNGIDTYKLTKTTDFYTRPTSQKAGLRAWRHNDGSPDACEDDYDQFSNFPTDGPGWMAAVETKLQVLTSGVDDEIRKKARGLCEEVQFRPERILAADLYKEDHHVSYIDPKTNKDVYDDLSTPNRDSFIRARMVAIEDTLCSYRGNDDSAKFYRIDLDTEGAPIIMCKVTQSNGETIVFPSSADHSDYDHLLDIKNTEFAECPINYGPRGNQIKILRLSDFEISLLSDPDPLQRDSRPWPYRNVSNNPNDPVEARWGTANTQDYTSQAGVTH